MFMVVCETQRVFLYYLLIIVLFICITPVNPLLPTPGHNKVQRGTLESNICGLFEASSWNPSFVRDTAGSTLGVTGFP